MVIQAQVIRDLKTSVKGVESVEAAFCSLTRRSLLKFGGLGM